MMTGLFKLASLAAATAALSFAAAAQEPEEPTEAGAAQPPEASVEDVATAEPAPDAPILLTAARLIDVEDGVVIEDAAVLVRNERIEAVGPASDVEVPEGVRRIDLGDATLLPGLIDSHVHLTSNHTDHGYNRLAISTPHQAINGVVNARRTLEAGVTAARNVGAGGYIDIALRDAIEAGDVPGPRLTVAGPSIGITGGHCDSNLLPPRYGERSDGVADGPWEVRAKVRENIKYGADVITYCGTGGVLSKGTAVGAPQYTLQEVEALIDEAHMHGRKVAVHAHGAAGINRALRAGVDSVEHASFIDEEGLSLAAETGAYLSMDIYVTDFILSDGEAMGVLEESLAKERLVGRTQRENFQRAVERGINIAFGTDAGVYPHGDNPRQLAIMVEWGMTPMQAVQTATLSTATLLGREEDIGSVSVGKYADIIAAPGDVLEDISVLEDVSFVMKGGEVYVGE